VLGSNIARALAFPLFFLVFSVPAGEILAPALMELTADSTVFLLTASGIPVVRDGLSFSTSDARWSVVEACSGLRYLIASLALGSLFAHLFYNDWIKRALFIAAAAALPIAANCLRAYAIVLIGHASSMKLAAGVDHFIYGWIFFALVVGSLFWVGLMFRDTPRNADRVPSRASHRPRPRTVFGAAMAAAGITASAPALAAYSAQFDTTEPARSLSAPEPANGWKKNSEAGAVFTPHFLNAWASTQQTYKKGDDVVTLFIAYYRNQRAHGEMINSQNVVVFREQKVWRKTSEGRVVHPFPMNQTEVSNGEIKLVVWHWYWVNHTYAADTMRAKLLQAQSQLFRGKDEAAAIFVSSQGNAMAMRDFLSSVDIKRALEDASRN
jgi:EpsI family protein